MIKCKIVEFYSQKIKSDTKKNDENQIVFDQILYK